MASRFEINRSLYFPDVSRIEFPTLAEARAEYSRLRKIAAKRLARLKASGYTESSVYQRYASSFSPLPRGLSETRVRKHLSEVAHFLSLKGSTISGEKEKIRSTIEALHEAGYDFVNEENIGAFGRFMDRMSMYFRGKRKDYSDQVIAIFEQYLDDAMIDPEALADAFADWMDSEKDPADFRYNEKTAEPIPGEIDRPARKRTARKTPAQKRAARNKSRADERKRNAKRRGRRK